MASIRKRQGAHGPSWQVLYKDPAGRQHAAGTYASEREAKRRMVEIEAKQRRGAADGDRMLFGDYVADRFASAYHAGPSRLAKVEMVLNCEHGLLAAVGDMPIGEIRRSDLAAWANALRRRGLAEATIKGYLDVAGTILNMAVDDEIIEHSPAASRARRGGGALRTTPARREAWLTEGQAERLLTAAPAHARTMLLVKLRCGLRYGELIGLTARDVIEGPFDDGAVSGPARLRIAKQLIEPDRAGHFEEAPPKQGSRRTIALDHQTFDALRTWIRSRPAVVDAPLFPSPGGGSGVRRGESTEPWSNTRFRRDVWLPSLTRAGLADLRWNGKRLRVHDLRHTHATWLLADRVPLNVVARRLGHADGVVTLKVYAHVMKAVESGELTARELHADAGGTGGLAEVRKLR